MHYADWEAEVVESGLFLYFVILIYSYWLLIWLNYLFLICLIYSFQSYLIQ